MSHKNCLSLIQSVPVCSECNVMSNYDYPPFTPVDQIQSPAKLNTQLETPSFTSSDQTIYNPRVTCTSEISEVTLTPPYEIAYVLNVQAPLIFNAHKPTLEDLQLKERVEEFLKVQLDTDKDVGQLVIFDILEVSVTGKSWDSALVCLFENYFLIYENELLVGIISVQHDISSVDVDEELILNLAKDSLPELRLRHSNKLVVQKWGTLLLEIIDNESVVTNIYQLTNTYWTHLPPEICVPQNLTKLNNAILSGTTISNSDIARILPTPKQLSLNLILALPLVNQTSLTDLEYKTQLQQIFQKTLHALRPNDKLGIIFLGIDGSKKPCAKGSFVGCTEPSWDIPLLPPVSPARDTVFAKRQTELTIINSLKKSIASGESQVSSDIIKSCISLAHGLIRTSLEGSTKSHTNESSPECEYSMLQLLMAVRYTDKGNVEYIDFLVNHMKSIAKLLESDLDAGKLRCSDLIIV
ncbi:hypothetical protein FOB64_003510 [Candida albicans]|uniref:Uncharacterized protein n=1 Tax=Candida albicans TaxID=5476 RepID=A0A8H6F4S1_CANAX|nr:hypothetical protein FOB64_003510 [Candida albicans]